MNLQRKQLNRPIFGEGILQTCGGGGSQCGGHSSIPKPDPDQDILDMGVTKEEISEARNKILKKRKTAI